MTADPPPVSRSDEPNQDPTLARDWRLLIALTFLYSFGFAIYNGVFQNYLRDGMHATPLHAGALESFREIPGLLAAVLAGSLVALAEARVAAVGLLVMALGMGLTGRFLQYWPLVGISIVWSVGFHVWATVSPAITLSLAKGKEGGRHLGRMGSVGGLGNLLALSVAYGLSLAFKKLPYEVYFVGAGVCIAAGGFLCLGLSHHASGARRQPFLFRREYGLYYLLSFLDGCRRQIVGTFAALTLILVYKVDLSTMLGLQFASTILVTMTAPRIGRLFDRVGERGPLTFYSLFLIGVFVGYALIPNREVLCVLFVLDRVAFGFSIGFNTFLHRIVRPGEFTPSTAMGVTMNHVAAVTVPVLGAWLWQAQGLQHYQTPFWIGVFVAIAAFLATRLIPDRVPTTSAASPAP
ncbi:MAG: MFS transporter [Fimbriimonadaceae bacterium]|nr:MFS transporter [Fimbriimonadaceae bacterium]